MCATEKCVTRAYMVIRRACNTAIAGANSCKRKLFLKLYKFLLGACIIYLAETAAGIECARSYSLDACGNNDACETIAIVERVVAYRLELAILAEGDCSKAAAI